MFPGILNDRGKLLGLDSQRIRNFLLLFNRQHHPGKVPLMLNRRQSQDYLPRRLSCPLRDSIDLSRRENLLLGKACDIGNRLNAVPHQRNGSRCEGSGDEHATNADRHRFSLRLQIRREPSIELLKKVE